MNKKILLFAVIIVSIGIVGIVLATQAFPSGETNLLVSSCLGEDLSTTSGNYVGLCNNITGYNLDYNDGIFENHTYHKQGVTRTYAGVRIQAVNTSITNCISVSSVFLCYEWWRPAASTPSSCRMAVSNNSAVTIVNVNTTCPGSVANPGVICQDVTLNQAWTCQNFFNTTGQRATAEVEVFEGGGTNLYSNLSIDVLFFNVSYTVAVLHD